MISNKYRTQEDLVATSISGGRPHHSYRLPVRAIKTYGYELTYGENFHSLSAVVFGTDEYWWVIDDMNKPKDAFSLQTGELVMLPTAIVKDKTGVKKIV